jgi:hypothetical protein
MFKKMLLLSFAFTLPFSAFCIEDQYLNLELVYRMAPINDLLVKNKCAELNKTITTRLATFKNVTEMREEEASAKVVFSRSNIASGRNNLYVQKCELKLRLTSDQYRIKHYESLITHKGKNKLVDCKEEQKTLESGAGILYSELSNTLFGCKVTSIISLNT